MCSHCPTLPYLLEAVISAQCAHRIWALKEMSDQMKYHTGLTLYSQVIIHFVIVMNCCYLDIMQFCCVNTSVIHLSYDKSLSKQKGVGKERAISTWTIKCQISNKT